jgi:hypothetical protein
MATLALCGCVSTDPQPTDDKSITRTIVYLGANGANKVKTDRIDMATHQQELRARAGYIAGKADAVVDTTCAGSSLWLFDSTNNTIGSFPFNHELCFYKQSSNPVCADLKQIVRFCECPGGIGCHFFCSSWFDADGDASPNHATTRVQSYWAGANTGYFKSIVLNGQTDFGIYQRVDAVSVSDEVVGQSQYVCFN